MSKSINNSDITEVFDKYTISTLDKVLSLYQKCLDEIDIGIFPCYIPLGHTPNRIIISAVVNKLRDFGLITSIVKKRITEEDNFHGHTYEIDRYYITIAKISKANI